MKNGNMEKTQRDQKLRRKKENGKIKVQILSKGENKTHEEGKM